VIEAVCTIVIIHWILFQACNNIGNVILYCLAKGANGLQLLGAILCTYKCLSLHHISHSESIHLHPFNGINMILLRQCIFVLTMVSFLYVLFGFAIIPQY
jgi:hypothetical protein